MSNALTCPFYNGIVVESNMGTHLKRNMNEEW
jgi:hypothetical protein